MPTPSILVATWDNRLFSVTRKMVHQELADQSVRSLVADGRGRVLAITKRSIWPFEKKMSDGFDWEDAMKSSAIYAVPIGMAVALLTIPVSKCKMSSEVRATDTKVDGGGRHTRPSAPHLRDPSHLSECQAELTQFLLAGCGRVTAIAPIQQIPIGGRGVQWRYRAVDRSSSPG